MCMCMQVGHAEEILRMERAREAGASTLPTVALCSDGAR